MADVSFFMDDFGLCGSHAWNRREIFGHDAVASALLCRIQGVVHSFKYGFVRFVPVP